MRLIEEYLARHNITNVPLAHHCSNGTLLLEASDEKLWNSRWILLSIEWVEDDFRPGKYKIEISTPVHDSYVEDFCEKSLFLKQQKIVPSHIKWQDYEDFIFEWVKSFKGFRPIREQRDIVLTAWEMFVFMYDGWFIKQSSELKQKLFETLDKEIPYETRYSNYQDVAVFLSFHHPSVMRCWKYDVLAVVLQNHADWLAHLIEDDYEPTQEEFLQK